MPRGQGRVCDLDDPQRVGSAMRSRFGASPYSGDWLAVAAAIRGRRLPSISYPQFRRLLRLGRLAAGGKRTRIQESRLEFVRTFLDGPDWLYQAIVSPEAGHQYRTYEDHVVDLVDKLGKEGEGLFEDVWQEIIRDCPELDRCVPALLDSRRPKAQGRDHPFQRQGFSPATVMLVLYQLVEPFLWARTEELETGLASIARAWEDLGQREKRSYFRHALAIQRILLHREGDDRRLNRIPRHVSQTARNRAVGRRLLRSVRLAQTTSGELTPDSMAQALEVARSQTAGG